MARGARRLTLTLVVGIFLLVALGGFFFYVKPRQAQALVIGLQSGSSSGGQVQANCLATPSLQLGQMETLRILGSDYEIGLVGLYELSQLLSEATLWTRLSPHNGTVSALGIGGSAPLGDALAVLYLGKTTDSTGTERASLCVYRK